MKIKISKLKAFFNKISFFYRIGHMCCIWYVIELYTAQPILMVNHIIDFTQMFPFKSVSACKQIKRESEKKKKHL